MSSIGNISLNLSFFIYLMWFLPQVALNFKRKNTAGLSLFMHRILLTGYLCDLMYGFSCHMQWQYRTVTMVGLLSLTVQQYQISYYSHPSKKNTFLNFIYLGLFFISIYFITIGNLPKKIADAVGMCANVCWLTYGIPQIIKNYKNQSTAGLSTLFVYFSIFLNMCDTTSAWTLDWDYPSKIGPTLSLIQNIILLCQVNYYGNPQKVLRPLVVNS